MSFITWLNNIVGCALSAPDGSSPRGYSRIFLGIDSKNDSSSIGLNFSSTSLIISYTETSYRTFFRMFTWLVSTSVIVLTSHYSHICDVISVINLFLIISWCWPLPMGSAVISQYPCPLVGCRFCSLHHVSAYVPSVGSYIRGIVGNFTIYQLLASAAATIVAHLAPLWASA
jgi:hypothetical protein